MKNEIAIHKGDLAVTNSKMQFDIKGFEFLGYVEVTKSDVDRGRYYLGIMFTEMKLYPLKDYWWEYNGRGGTGKFCFMFKREGEEVVEEVDIVDTNLVWDKEKGGYKVVPVYNKLID